MTETFRVECSLIPWNETFNKPNLYSVAQLHESGLRYNPESDIGDWIIFFIWIQFWLIPDWINSIFSFRIESSIWNEMSIRNHVNSVGSRFRCGMKLGTESTFIMVEIKIFCKIGSFRYEILISQLNLSCKYGWNWKCRCRFVVEIQSGLTVLD